MATTPSQRVLLAAVVVSLTACGAGGSDGPRFLSLATSAPGITESETVTFTAILTDPDGIEDLIGGSLLGEDGATAYGPFATAAQEGAYGLTLSWDQLQQVQPLDFVDRTSLVFVAEFFDEAGNATRQDVGLDLFCPDAGEAIAGECLALTECRCHRDFGCAAGTADPAPTCAARCSAMQMECRDGCELATASQPHAVVVFSTMAECAAGTGPGVPADGGDSCNAEITGFPAVRCCCSPL